MRQYKTVTPQLKSMMVPLALKKFLAVLACLVLVNTVPHRTILTWAMSIGPMAGALHRAVEQGVRGYRLVILSVGTCLMTAANIHFW
jgi:hypothetical protein